MYRDPVRSSHGHFVKAKGLRRVSLMLWAEASWARRMWALPSCRQRRCTVNGRGPVDGHAGFILRAPRQS